MRMHNMTQRTIAMKIREQFGIIFKEDFYVGISVQYIVNCGHIQFNKLVKHKILMHF